MNNALLQERRSRYLYDVSKVHKTSYYKAIIPNFCMPLLSTSYGRDPGRLREGGHPMVSAKNNVSTNEWLLVVSWLANVTMHQFPNVGLHGKYWASKSTTSPRWCPNKERPGLAYQVLLMCPQDLPLPCPGCSANQCKYATLPLRSCLEFNFKALWIEH